MQSRERNSAFVPKGENRRILWRDCDATIRRVRRHLKAKGRRKRRPFVDECRDDQKR
jgi:hypothetical protein